ncbi:MAG: ABC transporter permease [Endomicrobiaceae bacterium]|nr:ABC transporter permease [Endomicrobiaceae bacterium]MDD3921986.1 ABC transporter permease [Endomicrobiaceae bacterium]
MYYLIKRIISSIPILFGITIITFFIMHLTPGKPTDLMTDMNIKVTAEAKERLQRLYGLDKPIYVQYIDWVKRLVFFDFGNSFRDARPAKNKILERLPATILLNFVSLFFICLIAIPLGIYSAIKKDSVIDKGITIFLFISFSIPSFWLALVFMILFGVQLGCLPISGLYSFDFNNMTILMKLLDISKHLILPVSVSVITSLAILSRYTRSGMLEVLKQDYIKTAYAKGLTEKQVIIKHALKNALLPMITIIGLSIPGLIGGSFIFETIFSYPGIGRLGYEAVMARDYPVVMGIATLTAILTLLGNIIADISYTYADPRIKYK